MQGISSFARSGVYERAIALRNLGQSSALAHQSLRNPRRHAVQSDLGTESVRVEQSLNVLRLWPFEMPAAANTLASMRTSNALGFKCKRSIG